MSTLSDGLPYRVISLATDMFAREAGLTGPEIHRFFARYTDVLGPYPTGGGSPSRWQLFTTGLDSLSGVDQRRFLRELCDYAATGVRSGARPMPSTDDIARLRSQLQGATPGALAASDRLKQFTDWDSVQRSWQAALDKIDSDPEGAITAARTTLEGVCKHICDERRVPYGTKSDLPKLYKAAAGAMQISPDQHSDSIIKQILGGVSTVVEGLAGMRNILSDSHGRGKAAARPAQRHAKLAVNAGFAVAGFLIDTHVEKP